MAGLPPGVYAVRFELQGMRTTEASQRVDLGRTARVDVTLQVAIAESVQVTATAAPAIITSTQGGANLRADDVAKLANIRTVWGIAELAPGLTDNTPNPNQLTIAGGFAYDNQFLINGVDVADNIFGTPNNLFIEDALQEVQVLTSGISAEFGRFGGGVVNAITKSGGNIVQRQHAPQLLQPVVDQGNAVRDRRQRGAPEGRAAELRVDVRRTRGQGPAVVLHGRPVAGSLDARAAAGDGHPLLDRDLEQARRVQADRDGVAEPHACRAAT